jgi:hypothetical protein
MTSTKVAPAGTFNEKVAVAAKLAPASARKFWQMFAGLKLPA